MRVRGFYHDDDPPGPQPPNTAALAILLVIISAWAWRSCCSHGRSFWPLGDDRLASNRRLGLMAATPPRSRSSITASTPSGSSRPPSRCREEESIGLRLKRIPSELQSNRILAAFSLPTLRIAR
jgi:hypothetical protein